MNIIDVESLVIDRISQATDGSGVTFDEALRLIVATANRVDWSSVATSLRARPDARYLRLIEKARELLIAARMPAVATTHFESL